MESNLNFRDFKQIWARHGLFGAGQDSHTIGNGNHKEEFRLIAYEDKIYRW